MVAVAKGNGMPAIGSILSGEDIICLAHEPWHGPWKTYQQIMSLLARSNRVFYVGPPVSLRTGINALRKGKRDYPAIERITDTLYVYHEPALWAQARGERIWSRLFNWCTERLRLAHVRWLARREGMHSPILWVFDAMKAHAVGTFREKLVVYQVLDNYVEFFSPEASSLRAAMASNEAKMLAQADVVFAVSESLHQRCARANAHSFLVPNGVDYDFFQATIAHSQIPPDIRSISGPIIGYVGSIQPHIDFSLLERLVTEHPKWSLVLVGPEGLGNDRSRFEALLGRPNVHYLGCKAVKDVPVYINSCDVCLMPYGATSSTVPDCDSIKLYEYLACGKPIVSTDFPSIRRVSQLVWIARDDSEFVKYVGESLVEEAGRQIERKAAAREHSWQRRVEFLSEVIQSRLSASAVPVGQRAPEEAGHHIMRGPL